MIRYIDISRIILRELCALAEQVRSAPAGKKKAAALASRIGAVTIYLEDSGALQQMLWWDKAEPEAPPGAKANVIEFSGPGLVS